MLLVASHYLVYWVEQDCVVIVKREQVMGDGEIGTEQDVRWGKKCYKAKVAAIGNCMHTH